MSTPRPSELAAIGGYALVAILLALISLEPRFGTPVWIPVLLGAVGVVVLVLRRSRPVPAVVAAAVLALLSLAWGTGAEALVVLIALHGVGVRRSPAVAWSCFGVALIAAAGAAGVFTARLASGPSLWGSPPVTPRDAAADGAAAWAAFALVLLITSLLGTIAGQRRRLVASLVDRAERLARERDQQAEIATARERERIAREMHDVIAHSLSVMIALADGARAAADHRPDEVKDVIGRVAQTGRRTLGEVRRLLGSVRGDPTDPALHAPQPDASQLAALVDQSVAAGLPVRLTETGPRPDDPAVGLSVYRIVQESLTNVLRHAREVEDVRVEVAWSAGTVDVLVRDRSAPVAPGDGAGRGILGMRERAALFDGEAAAGPHGGGGWQVSARLHWEEDRP